MGLFVHNTDTAFPAAEPAVQCRRKEKKWPGGKSKKKRSSVKKDPAGSSVETYKNKIVTFLKKHDKKTMQLSQLEAKCRTKKGGRENFAEAFHSFVQRALSWSERA